MKEEAEIRKYGRTWIWEGYFNEGAKPQWLETAEMLKHVNSHVIEDMQDAIMLEGFKGMRSEKIRVEIEEDIKRRITEEVKLQGDDGPEYLKWAEAREKRRKFLNEMRPPKIWNFFDDSQGEKIDHVIRYNANPAACYQDGRIQKIMANVQEVAANLATHNEEIWKALLRNTLEVFKAEKAKREMALDAVS